MKRFRAMKKAVPVAVGLSLAAATSLADSPSAAPFDPARIIRKVAPPTARSQDDPSPEPASLTLFGIGISGLITLRRFRKLFN